MRQTGKPSDCHCEMRLYVTGSILALIGFLIACVGYWYSNSTAVLADGLHALADSTDLFLSLVVLLIVRGNRHNERGVRQFGAEIAFALLVISTLGIFLGGMWRLIHPEPVHVGLMLASATLGALVNWYVLRLSHKTPEHERTNTHAQMHIHVVGDLVVSLSVIATAVIYYFFPFELLDPTVAILVSLYMAAVLWKRAYRRIRG